MLTFLNIVLIVVVKLNLVRCDNASSGTSHCGKSQTFTLEQLGLQGYENSDDFEILLQDALLQWVVENCDIKFTIVGE